MSANPAPAEPTYFPYVKTTTFAQYEVDGAKAGKQISTVVQTIDVDQPTGTVYNTSTTSTEHADANGLQSGATYTEQVTHTLPLATNTTTWCLGMPSETRLINSHSQTDGAPITRTIQRSWDTSTKCRLNSETLEPNDTTWGVTTTLTYDDAAGEGDPDVGHVTKVDVAGANMATRTTKFSYGTDGRFLSKISFKASSTLWEETNFGWDGAKGQPTSSTDSNNLTAFNRSYDNFGRRIRESRPDGTYTTWSYNRCTGTSCIGDSTLRWYEHETEFANGGSVINSSDSYFDAAGRGRYEDTPTLSGSSRVKSTYDTLGRLTQQTLPYSIGGSSFTQTFGYDAADRVTSITRPISASDSNPQTTSIFYEGLTTRVQDALSHTQTRVQNVWGSMVRSQDHNGYYQNFAYDAFGNVTRVTDSTAAPNNVLQTNSYNVRGMKTAMTDMDAGSYTYQPNALGELEYVRDLKTTAPAWTTEMTYDLLGRVKTRKDVAENVTSQFNYGTAAPNFGRLQSVVGNGHSETFEYDANTGRLKKRTIVSDATYVYDYSYNALGLLDVLQYPTSTSSYRFAVKHEYTNGFLTAVKDNQAGTSFWRASASDAFGNVTTEQLGNGLSTTRGFDAVTGLLASIQTTSASSGPIQNLTYAWDKVGNLTQRHDGRQSLTEEFYYDNLNRLDCSTLNVVRQANCAAVQTQTNLNVDYDQLGNITLKSNAGGTGAYVYDTTKKHRVLTVGGTGSGSHAYAYDLNGNMNSRDGFGITWSSYNLPTVINGANNSSSQFFYTADRARWKQVASYGGTPETTIYIGGLVEKVTLGATTSWKHYVVGGSGPVAVYTRKSTGTNEVHYLTTDHLGSIDSITDSTGNPEVRLSYGPFGERRNEAGWSNNPTPADWTEITDTTRRGFTFHEMLDNLNLTHMNGRVYDQISGRFLSADPFVPDPESTQSFNRYSYVSNNPLRYTDPSGFTPSPDDPPPGVPPTCRPECFDPYDDPWFGPYGPDSWDQRTKRGRPVPRIELRGGAQIVPVKSLECDQGICGSAQKTKSPAFWRTALSVGAGFVPIVGSVQSVVEVVSGRDYITGEKTSRVWAAVGIVAGLVGAKGIIKGISKADDVVRAAKAAVRRIEGVTEGAADVVRRTCCFVAGTLVMTESGLRPIEEIEVGDRVLSRDEVTGETAYKPVTELIRRHDREIWEVRIAVEEGSDSFEVFETTDDHPWRTSDAQWVRTEQQLTPGVRIKRANGAPAPVISVIKTDRVAFTYNLEVSDFHSYFVGNSGVWVHNSCSLLRSTTDILATKDGLINVRATLDRIKAGIKFPHRNDGKVFKNREGRLPQKPEGYYREYVHPTPGAEGAGKQRVVVGEGGELYFTLDHYESFIPIN